MANSDAISLRISIEDRMLIDRAAEAAHKSRSEFLLDSARAAAAEALLDRTLFVLADKDFKAFAKALDKAPTSGKILAGAPQAAEHVDEVDVSPLRALEPGDDLSVFDCGTPALDEWLRKRAMLNHLSGASRTYVAVSGKRVAAYYCLAAGAIHHTAAPGAIRRNMPEPIPAIVLGRLAVDQNFKGQGLGGALLEDAIRRTHQIAELAGIRALLVHAMDENAAHFYRHFGFVVSPLDPLILMIKISL